jgi:peptidoglycan hydrolase CwlO-like protein
MRQQADPRIRPLEAKVDRLQRDLNNNLGRYNTARFNLDSKNNKLKNDIRALEDERRRLDGNANAQPNIQGELNVHDLKAAQQRKDFAHYEYEFPIRYKDLRKELLDSLER